MIENATLKVPGDKEATLAFCVHHWLAVAKKAIEDHGAFYVALSGGSTPKAIFQALAKHADLAWDKVYLFWSDERNVPPTHEESNFHMAMEAGFKHLPVSHVYRMKTEEAPEAYEKTIKQVLGTRPFDMVMLGMGPDGHTASLFPLTEALKEKTKWVVTNYVPQKSTYRMTMTYPCLNQAQLAVFYVIGQEKQAMLKEILQDGHAYPARQVGTAARPALWIADKEAAGTLC